MLNREKMESLELMGVMANLERRYVSVCIQFEIIADRSKIQITGPYMQI